jgi:phage gpG-like protein
MPLPLRIETRTTGDLALLPKLERASFQAMQRSVLRVLRRAMQNLTGRFLRVRTGRLRASLTARAFVLGNEVVGVVGTNVFYGRIHEEGVPHPWPIVPRRKKALRFTVGGKVVFARRVMHPGLKARPWLSTAAEESRAEIIEEFRQAYARVAGGEGA